MMIKIRTIIRNKKNQETTAQTATFPSAPTFQQLKTHVSAQVRWKYYQIDFENRLTEQVVTVDSDEVLQLCYLVGDDVTFIVTRKQSGLFLEEVSMLVQEGFPKGQCRALLRKFGGDVVLARNELELRRKVHMLASDGFPRGKCRKVLNLNGGDVEAARKALNGTAESGGVKELVEEGIPKKLAVRLIKRYRGDLKLAREDFYNPKPDYEKTAEELYSQGFKPKRRVLRLLVKYNGDSEKVKEEISASRKRPRSIDTIETDRDCRKKKRHYETQSENIAMDDLGIPFSDVSTIYLDGNNMLYIEKEMRDFAIRGRNRIHAERMLANLVLSYSQRSPEERKFKLMFDATSFHGYTDINFEIICARQMGFDIADDALVHISEVNPAIRDSSVFVTSDKELIERLKALGSFVMKPKAFLAIVKELIGQDYEDILDQQMNLIE